MFLRRPPLPVNDLVVLRSLRPLLPILLLIRSITRSAAHHVQLGVTDLLQQQARPPRYRHRFERDKNFSKDSLHSVPLLCLRPTSARWLAHLTASTFNPLGQPAMLVTEPTVTQSRSFSLGGLSPSV